VNNTNKILLKYQYERISFMRHFIIYSTLAVALMAMTAALRADGDKPGAGPASISQSAHQQDEQAIRQLADACSKSYNTGDAKGLADLFAPDAVITSEEGESTQGRDAIEQVFAEIFKAHPKRNMEITIQSIVFASPIVAIEDGSTTVTYGEKEPVEHDRYRVVHVKQDGKWQMASVTDLPDEEATSAEELKELDWLIGDWIDESPDALIETTYHWTDNHCFILGEFTVQIGGRPAMTGSQRIGWDPLAKKIRSWVFDSEGGFGEGLWTKDGKQWIAKMIGVTRNGKAASSTNIITYVIKERMTWQSRDRIVGGEKKPDTEVIPIVHKPPQPTK
jgi:uncharacterized protein (TIGR02246 family)